VGNKTDVGGDQLRWGGGVSAELPVFDRHQGRLRTLEAEFDTWLERYQGLAIDLRSAAREASARLHSAERRARQYADVIVPAQNQVMEQTQLQYNAMQLGVFQLLEARREQLAVALDYTETLREYWSAKAEIDAILAGRVVDFHMEPAERAAGQAAADLDQGGH
jgi:outer membrane protein TolC